VDVGSYGSGLTGDWEGSCIVLTEDFWGLGRRAEKFALTSFW
jgi:hypothetical protein